MRGRRDSEKIYHKTLLYISKSSILFTEFRTSFRHCSYDAHHFSRITELARHIYSSLFPHNAIPWKLIHWIYSAPQNNYHCFDIALLNDTNTASIVRDRIDSKQEKQGQTCTAEEWENDRQLSNATVTDMIHVAVGKALAKRAIENQKMLTQVMESNSNCNDNDEDK